VKRIPTNPSARIATPPYPRKTLRGPPSWCDSTEVGAADRLWTASTGNSITLNGRHKAAVQSAVNAQWGWAAFEYDAASDAFRPRTAAEQPPQANDAKCGFGCHTIVKARDYVFTEYGKR